MLETTEKLWSAFHTSLLPIAGSGMRTAPGSGLRSLPHAPCARKAAPIGCRLTITAVHAACNPAFRVPR